MLNPVQLSCDTKVLQDWRCFRVWDIFGNLDDFIGFKGHEFPAHTPTTIFVPSSCSWTACQIGRLISWIISVEILLSNLPHCAEEWLLNIGCKARST